MSTSIQEEARKYYEGTGPSQIAPRKEGEPLSVHSAINEVMGTFDSISQAMTILEEKLGGIMRSDVNSAVAPGPSSTPLAASPMASIIISMLMRQREIQNRIGDLLGRVDL